MRAPLEALKMMQGIFSAMAVSIVRVIFSPTAAPIANSGAKPAGHVDLTGPVALLIGNEGNGVPEALAAQADNALTIPCPGPVESLNAAIATSILLYEASRQRRANP